MFITGRFVRLFFTMAMLFPVFAQSASSNSINTGSAESALNSSPNDVSQLLSTLKEENNSIITQTPLTPFFKKWERAAQQLDQKTGLNLGLDYVPLLEHAYQTLGRQNASGGELQLFGKWSLLKEKKHSPLIGFKIEDKHRYSPIYPSQLAEQFDSIIKTVSGYKLLNPSVTELWFQSALINNSMAFRIGKIDLTSVMNSYAFDSRRFFFLSDAFSSTPAIDKPTKGLGVIAGIKIAQHFYLSSGINDLNGEDDNTGFNTLHRSEFIKAIEFGYRDKVINPQSDNYHVFLWQSDAQQAIGKPSDHGYSVVLQKNIANRFIPFFKANINSGRVKDIKQLYTSGFGYHYPFNEKYGLLGLAAGYAVLSDKQLGHQIIVESFYRIQLTPDTQITPDVQMIYTANPSHWVPVMNLRFRTAI